MFHGKISVLQTEKSRIFLSLTFYLRGVRTGLSSFPLFPVHSRFLVNFRSRVESKENRATIRSLGHVPA